MVGFGFGFAVGLGLGFAVLPPCDPLPDALAPPWELLVSAESVGADFFALSGVGAGTTEGAVVGATIGAVEFVDSATTGSAPPEVNAKPVATAINTSTAAIPAIKGHRFGLCWPAIGHPCLSNGGRTFANCAALSFSGKGGTLLLDIAMKTGPSLPGVETAT